jgi:predicted lipoprotein
MPIRTLAPLIFAQADLPQAAAPVSAGALSIAAARDFIVPRYRALKDAAVAQERAWDRFCADRARGDIETLREAYHAVADAWAEAQIIKTGPVTLFLRFERFAYWPEARNATARALESLLASRNPGDLKPEALRHDSVAGQGITALERLLYETPDALKTPDAHGTWRTEVGKAIARNLGVIASDVLEGWEGPDGVVAALEAGKGWNNLFADAPEAARLLLTDLVTIFKSMHDVKLLPVLGADVDSARPKLAEAWRSARSARNLQHNLKAARALSMVFAARIPGDHRAWIVELFDAADKAAAALPSDMGDAASDPQRRVLLENARAAIKAVQTELATTLPADLGLTLGFNSLDGD